MSLIQSLVYLKPEVDAYLNHKLTTVDSADSLKNITNPFDGQVVFTKYGDHYIYTTANNGWTKISLPTVQGIDVNTWLTNTIVTPDMLLGISGNDDLKAFKLAASLANSLMLPVTLLPRAYYINDVIDLRLATHGVVSATKRFSDTRIVATANPNKAEVFADFRNMDRSRLEGITIDGGGFYDVVLDTSYPTVGPSLNLTFSNLWIRGYRNIGWRANNNNDVYFNKCMIVEPTNVVTELVAFNCIGIGGPIQISNCNFLNGKTQVCGQHIETTQCVLAGVEFMPGSWNVYHSDGTHHFADSVHNACFIITGEVWGFTVTGGLCEANNGGILIYGNGGKTITGQLLFNGVRISPDQGTMVLDSGSLAQKFGTLVLALKGGMVNLSNLSTLTFFDDVSLLHTNDTVNTKSKDVVAGATVLRNYRNPNSNIIGSKYAKSGDIGTYMCAPMVGIKTGDSSYFGTIDELSNHATSGNLYLTTSDNTVSAQYQIVNTLKSDGSVVWSIKEIYNICSTSTTSTDSSNVTTTTNDNSFKVYVDKDLIQILLTKGGTGITSVNWAFVGFNAIF